MKLLIPTLRGLRVEVKAHPVGDWASHKALESDHAWTVTHVPSGLRIPRYYPKAEACRLTERLAMDVPTLPVDVRHWDKQPTTNELGPEYREHLERLLAIVTEFSPVEDHLP